MAQPKTTNTNEPLIDVIALPQVDLGDLGTTEGAGPPQKGGQFGELPWIDMDQLSRVQRWINQIEVGIGRPIDKKDIVQKIAEGLQELYSEGGFSYDILQALPQEERDRITAWGFNSYDDFLKIAGEIGEKGKVEGATASQRITTGTTGGLNVGPYGELVAQSYTLKSDYQGNKGLEKIMEIVSAGRTKEYKPISLEGAK